MLIVQDESILSLVPDYRINLIAPGEMSEEELELFTSNFREGMQFIKYSKDTEKLSQLVEENTAFETMDRKAVRVMEEMTGMKIEKEVEEEKVNVCKGLRDLQEKERVEGIQIGAEHEQRLTKALLNDNRIDDLKRALDDSAFRQKLLEEYGID